MTYFSETAIVLHEMEKRETSKPDLIRQNSAHKRHMSNSASEEDLQKFHTKHGRFDTCEKLVCPFESLGCLVDKSCETLEEHYGTATHQEKLMIIIGECNRQARKSQWEDSPTPKGEEEIPEILEDVSALAEGISCLQDDNMQLHNTSVQLQRMILEQSKMIEVLKSSVEESNQITQAIQMNTTVLETEIESLRQLINELRSVSSNDGTFLWKITDVSKKIKDAISEQQTSIYSPPFYSSPTGYKMCMRIYFNGDGHARRTHLSLFFVLMRGDYDSVLQWPFNYKITFCLYDQSQNQRHIIDSFRPDVKSNSFQRPRSNMNIASGIPKFCPLANIQQDNNPYVADDCMFIRCIVDFSSTHKTMLPFICNLNPGLPTAMRRTMIEAEIERRKSETLPNSSPKPEDTKAN